MAAGSGGETAVSTLKTGTARDRRFSRLEAGCQRFGDRIWTMAENAKRG